MKFNIKKYFELRGKLNRLESVVIGLFGLISVLFLWYLATSNGWVEETIVPSPSKVFSSFSELHTEDFLIMNAAESVKLNFWGYIKAILWSLPIGFVIGMFPFFRALLSNYVTAARFLPLSALVGMFILWFGIEADMKINFLAFGIMVYLIPTIVQRIDEVSKTYVDMIYTLGANKWQTIWNVFIPAVLSKISDDIRVLVAISWTYIIIAEMVNKEGGVGAMIFTAARQSRTDKVFAILIVIILIGFLQDKLFKFLDQRLFPHKHIKK
jgi:NitT/TauT family transport system permease protein